VRKIIAEAAPLLGVQPVDETRQALVDRLHIDIPDPKKGTAGEGMTIASH
jgi:hypothetical protein